MESFRSNLRILLSWEVKSLGFCHNMDHSPSDSQPSAVLHVAVNAVTVNNGTARQVLVMPLRTTPPSGYAISSSSQPCSTSHPTAVAVQSNVVSHQLHIITKIMIRVENKKSSKVFRNYMLKGIDTAVVSSCEELKKAIRTQLKDVISKDDFDIGYVQGIKVIRIQSRLDVQEFWQNFRTSNLVLWCDGLKSDDDGTQASSTSKKRKVQNSNQEGYVQKIVDDLKKRAWVSVYIKAISNLGRNDKWTSPFRLG